MKFLKVLFLLCLPILASAEYFHITHFDVNIRLDASGYVEVTEVIDVEFTQPRRGIFRTIPMRYRLPDNAKTFGNNSKDLTAKFYDINAEGRTIKVTKSSNQIKIRIGDADIYVEGAQRYTIRYKMKPGVLFYEDYDEFYWNLTGNEWPVRIDSVSYQIELPEAQLLFPSKDFYVYTGATGESFQNATIQLEDNQRILKGNTTKGLSPREGITVAVKLTKGMMHEPSEVEQLWNKYGLLGVPAMLGLLIWGLWRRFGKDKAIVKMVRFYPPEGIHPSEAGKLIDDRVDNRDLTALIPKWANEGIISIENIEKDSFWGSKSEFVFNRLQDLPNDAPSYERTMYNGLFSTGDRTEIKDLKNKFYKTLNTAKQELGAKVKTLDWYEPSSYNAQIGMGCLSAVAFVTGVILMAAFENFLAGGLTFLVAFVMGGVTTVMLRKTNKGHQLYEELYGFKMFMEKAEKDKIERLLKDDPTYFEDTLPFALAFGMVKQWGKKFDGLMTQPPHWYHGHYHANNGFSGGDFADQLDGGFQQMQSAFSSAPNSSGGASGGGGFSGGGMGGGGGGSW